MKEKIVITQDWLVKDMKAGIPELDKLFICQKVEQVPETWEELCELCKTNKYITIEKEHIVIDGFTTFSNMTFCKDKAFFLNTDCFFTDLEYKQMWQIIKNLIGE